MAFKMNLLRQCQRGITLKPLFWGKYDFFGVCLRQPAEGNGGMANCTYESSFRLYTAKRAIPAGGPAFPKSLYLFTPFAFPKGERYIIPRQEGRRIKIHMYSTPFHYPAGRVLSNRGQVNSKILFTINP